MQGVSRLLDDWSPAGVAFHEAAHLTAAAALGSPVDEWSEVTIFAEGGGVATAGWAHKVPDRLTRQQALQSVIELAAGEYGQRRAVREGLASASPTNTELRSDRSDISRLLLTHDARDQEHWLREQAAALVEGASFWIACRAVAIALLESGHLKGPECLSLIESSQRERRVTYNQVTATETWSARSNGGVGRITTEVTRGELFYGVAPEARARPERFRQLGAGEWVYVAERHVVAPDGDWGLAMVSPGDEVSGLHPCVSADRDGFRRLIAA